MSESDIKPGNPIRVPCRTCNAASGQPCVFNRHHVREFHGSRCRAAFADWRANGSTQDSGDRAPRRRSPPRAKPHRARGAIATLGELPQVERAVGALDRSALDINERAFWEKAWSE